MNETPMVRPVAIRNAVVKFVRKGTNRVAGCQYSHQGRHILTLTRQMQPCRGGACVRDLDCACLHSH